MAAHQVNGKLPAAYFNDLRTPGRARIQEVGEAAMVEARSTLLNPKYLGEMLQEGPSAAGQFAEAMRNTFGWEVTRPGMIADHLWEDYKKVYLDDSLQLGMKKFFEEKNPYALQEMTGVMLESIRKGFWEASPETTREIAERHAELVRQFGAGCSTYVCDNAKVRELVARELSDPAQQQQYRQAIEKIRRPPAPDQSEVSGQTLREEKSEPEPAQPEKKDRRLGLLVGIILAGVLVICLGKRRRTSCACHR